MILTAPNDPVHAPLCWNAFADEAGDSLSEQIEAMKKNHIRGLEIRKINGKNVSELTVEEAREIRKALEDEGLYIWSVGSPIGKIRTHEPFEEHLEKYRHTLEIGCELGARAFRLFSFYPPNKGEDPGPYKDQIFEWVGKLCEIGKPYGIPLCHENEKGIYGARADRCVELLDAFPDLGCVFDPANFIQSGEDIETAWQLLRTRVSYLHIKDARPNGTVVPPGEGIGHLPEILADYIALGGGNLTLEPHLKTVSEEEAAQINADPANVRVYTSRPDAFRAACDALAVLTSSL